MSKNVEKIAFYLADYTLTIFGNTKIVSKATEYKKCNNISFYDDKIYSYSTKVGIIDRQNKILYLTNKKYSVTTTRHLNKLAYLMSKKGFKIVWQDNI